ncbi:MAG: M20/M25/M40 family metallo-hydrolase [Candidatus Hydrothermales bacterium]
MNEIKKLLRELTSFDAPSGRESELSAYIENYLKELGFKTEIDYFGNVTARLQKNSGKRIVLTAHIDQILLYVTRVDRNYIILDTRMSEKSILKGKEVILITKRGKYKGIIGMTPPHLKGKGKEEYIYIDLGLINPQEIEVKAGDPVVFYSEFKELGEYVCAGRSFDNRASVALLLYSAKDLKDISFKGEVILYLTVQEEISGLGASLLVRKLNPDIVLCFDVTFAKAKLDEESEIELNKGPAISKGPFITRKISDKLIAIAKREEIPYQIEVLESYTGTDLDVFFVKDGGVPSALISIPLRYMHSPNEVLDIRDILRAKKLILSYIREELT